jgi:hypothetical protein
MPSPKPAVWVEYRMTDEDGTDNIRIVRLHTSELEAWRTAGPAGNLVTRLPYGTTLIEHLADRLVTLDPAVVEVKKPVKDTA